jgi:hypothetical protein
VGFGDEPCSACEFCDEDCGGRQSQQDNRDYDKLSAHLHMPWIVIRGLELGWLDKFIMVTVITQHFVPSAEIIWGERVSQKSTLNIIQGRHTLTSGSLFMTFLILAKGNPKDLNSSGSS